MAAIALFVFKQQSRNAINNDRWSSQAFCSNYEHLFDCRLPHQDTVGLFLERLPGDYLETVKSRLINRLIEKRLLDHYRCQGYYLVAIDATGVCSSSHDRFGCGVTRRLPSGQLSYQHLVLEARLVTDNGLCLPLATEWITNESQGEYDKQDCESKAFKRLAVKLKQTFARLPVCILGDALYANAPVMELCEQHGWKYLITLKDGNLPAVQNCLRDDRPDGSNSYTTLVRSDNPHQQRSRYYHWVNNLLHEKHWFNYIRCEETCQHLPTGRRQTTNFVRITNLKVDADTVAAVSKAGRLRWKIENEGFNTQKNGGYAMEHLFSRTSFTALKNYYQCMLIGYMINQFADQSLWMEDLRKTHKKLTVKYLWQWLLSELRTRLLCTGTITAINEKRHQIRLRSG